jgi:biotin carboxylase
VKRGKLIVVGSGDPALREYALAAMSERAEIALLGYRRPTWEKPYVSEYDCVDLEDAEQIVAAAKRMAPDGIVTYDERLVENTALAASVLGLPGPDPAAVTLCKDKSRLRERLAEAGVSQVSFGVAHDLSEAVTVASAIGYPVVLKPRGLSGSIGVTRVDAESELPDAFAMTAQARVGLSAVRHQGVLIEEYLDGPEYSVDCVTTSGVVTPLVVAGKLLAFSPYFEEAGHVVPPRAAAGLDEAVSLVRQVHAVLGLDWIATHSEVRLTSRGPRIIEVNARLGGDLIPYLGQLALGVNAAGAVADVAMGREPAVAVAGTERVAAVRMFYPHHDVQLESVELRDPERIAGLDSFHALARRGAILRLPPRGFLSRLAAVVVTGADHEECESRLTQAELHLTVQGTPG